MNKESSSVDRELRAVWRDVSLRIDEDELGFLLALEFSMMHGKGKEPMRTVMEEKWAPVGFILMTSAQDRYDSSDRPISLTSSIQAIQDLEQ